MKKSKISWENKGLSGEEYKEAERRTIANLKHWKETSNVILRESKDAFNEERHPDADKHFVEDPFEYNNFYNNYS